MSERSSEQETITRAENQEELTEILYHLRYLNATQRADFVACELVGMTRTERAHERGVEPPTVMANVSNAADRLDELTDVDMDSFTAKHYREHD